VVEASSEREITNGQVKRRVLAIFSHMENEVCKCTVVVLEWKQYTYVFPSTLVMFLI